jgi:hypothetical protein
MRDAFTTRLCVSVAAGVALLAISTAAPAESPPSSAEHEENSGQDPTKPVTRIDFRLKYQDSSGDFDSEILTLRADKPFAFENGWKLSTRIDLPIVRTNTITPFENSDGGYEVGVGDVLVQALVVTPSKGKWAFAFGGQLLMPTGADDQFTSGKWRLVPTAAVIYQVPELSRGSFVGLLVRDDFSFAGDGDRPDTNVVSVQPLFNWALPDKWFVTLSPEIKFNAKEDWKLFLPFDVTVGKKINARTVVSLQGDVALINDYEQYDWQVEARVGVFF